METLIRKKKEKILLSPSSLRDKIITGWRYGVTDASERWDQEALYQPRTKEILLLGSDKIQKK